MRTVAIIVALLCVTPLAHADSLTQLINRADMALRGKRSAGVFTMQIKTESYERSFKIVVWEDSTHSKNERTLVKILGPALWRGHGTLKVGEQLKLYNPRTNHVTVVSNSMLGNSWMGSHFSNDDLVQETRLARDYKARLLKKWSGKNAQGQAVTFHDVELTPRPTAPVAWGKIEYQLWARADLVLPVHARYFRKARATRPDRTLTFSDVKQLGGRELPATMTMTVARKPGEHTAITYQTLRFDLDIPASKFTEQALRH